MDFIWNNIYGRNDNDTLPVSAGQLEFKELQVTKNHKWEKDKKYGILYKGIYLYSVNPKKCINCGLKKCNVPTGWRNGGWSDIIYFENPDKILSIGRIPYSCCGNEITQAGQKIKYKKKEFIAKEDFYV